MSENFSGFAGGYAIASLYPNLGTGVSQTAETIPETEEQAALALVDQLAPVAINQQSTKNMLFLCGGIILIIFLASRG